MTSIIQSSLNHFVPKYFHDIFEGILISAKAYYFFFHHGKTENLDDVALYLIFPLKKISSKCHNSQHISFM